MNTKLILLDQLLPGAVLGDNVHDDAGHILLRAGAMLGESAIEALKRRGVAAVSVAQVERNHHEHLEHEQARLEALLQESFRYAGDGEATRQLRQALFEFKLEAE